MFISFSKIPDLPEKVGELKNWKQIGLVFVTAVVSSIFSGTIGGVIGWLIRSVKAEVLALARQGLSPPPFPVSS